MFSEVVWVGRFHLYVVIVNVFHFMIVVVTGQR